MTWLWLLTCSIYWMSSHWSTSATWRFTTASPSPCFTSTRRKNHPVSVHSFRSDHTEPVAFSRAQWFAICQRPHCKNNTISPSWAEESPSSCEYDKNKVCPFTAGCLYYYSACPRPLPSTLSSLCLSICVWNLLRSSHTRAKVLKSMTSCLGILRRKNKMNKCLIKNSFDLLGK